MGAPVVVIPPAAEPITLAQARVFLRLDVPGYAGDASQDDLIESWIRAARQWIERSIDRCIGVQTLVLTLDGFTPGASSMARWQVPIELPNGPVRSITSIEYLDNESPLDNPFVLFPSSSYRLTSGDPQYAVLRGGFAWPFTVPGAECVRITYLAGYGFGPDNTVHWLGEDVIAALRMLLAHFYFNRSATTAATAAQELPLGVKALLWPNRASVGI